MTDAKRGNKELHREAYGKAMSRLRDAHPEEFNVLRTEEAKARGLDWKPKPSEKDKARETLARILADHPELAEAFTGEPEAQLPDPDAWSPPHAG